MLRGALTHRALPWVLGLVACLPVAGAIGGGFQLDDHFQRLTLLGQGGREPLSLFVFYDGDPAKNLAGMDAGWLPWWAAPTLRHASLRYLSVLTMQLDYLLWPSHPALMHLHSLAWLAALVVAASYFYRQLLTPAWVAALAGVLYALDDAHALPAAYLANRNALIATFFGVLALASFARGRAVWAAAFLALALAAGEIALAAAGHLAAYALCLDRDSLARRARKLAPSAAVLAAWALAYRLGGFGAASSGFYTDPARAPAAFASALLERAPILLMGQWTPVPADMALVFAPGSAQASHLHVFALATLAVLIALLAPLVRRDATARFFALGSALSLLPVAAVGPQNRLLFFVGLGAMGLVAQLVHRAVSQRWWWLAAAPLLAVHLLLAPPLSIATLGFHERASHALDRAIASAPADESLARQDLVLVNPPDYVYTAAAIPAVRIVESRPRARRMRALADGGSALDITRVDDRTLRVRLERSLFPDDFSRYFRAAELRFAPGETVELTRFRAEIESLDSRGDPDTIVFRFPVPLEDDSLRFLEFREGVWIPWRPPAPGQTVHLAESPGIFG